MAIARVTQFASLLVAGSIALLTSACATGDLLTNQVEVAGVRYEAQECVEHALRNQPEAETVREAATAFTTACSEGEVASCSVLGVMYELGRGFPADPARALALYSAACEAHNARACGNRDHLLLIGNANGSPAREPAQVSQLLAKSEHASGA